MTPAATPRSGVSRFWLYIAIAAALGGLCFGGILGGLVLRLVIGAGGG
jgi:hypothetical protein